jgi:hypothetical protein
LDLAKEIHNHLEDVPPTEAADRFKDVNKCLKRLEKEAGPLAIWGSGGDKVIEQAKKAVKAAMAKEASDTKWITDLSAELRRLAASTTEEAVKSVMTKWLETNGTDEKGLVDIQTLATKHSSLDKLHDALQETEVKELTPIGKKRFGEKVIAASHNANQLATLVLELEMGLDKRSFNAEKLQYEQVPAITGPTDKPTSFASSAAKAGEGYEGWLMKRGPRKNDAWQLRYCRLGGRRFTYGATEDYAKIKGEFLIRAAHDCKEFKSKAASKEAQELATEKPFGFEITSEGRDYLFDAREETSMQKWMAALKRIG